MANNKAFDLGFRLYVTPTAPAAPLSGLPAVLGIATGVCLTDADATGACTVEFGPGVWNLSVTDSVGGGIAIGDALFANAVTGAITNDSTGIFFGYALAIVGAGLTATIQVAHVMSPGAGTLGAGTIGTNHLAAGLLSADAAGRAKMAASYFDVATVLAKFAAGSFTEANLLSLIPADAVTNAVLLDAVLNGAFQADANTRALFADRIWPELKIALASLTGNVVAVNAADAAVGSIPVLHRFAVPDMATGALDFDLTYDTRVLDVWLVKTTNASSAHAHTIQVQSVGGADNITNAISLNNVPDTTIVRAGLANDVTLAAGVGALRVDVVRADAAGQVACDVIVLGVRV